MSKEKLILGAIAGDIIGSVYEWNNIKTVDFDLFCGESDFTDDSVLTVATMYATMNQKTMRKYIKNLAGIIPIEVTAVIFVRGYFPIIPNHIIVGEMVPQCGLALLDGIAIVLMT